MINVKGFSIGIESQGDPNSRLKQSLNDFAKNKCDIIFCAARTRGMTVNWIMSHSKQYHINFNKQKVVMNKQQAQSNQSVAQNIIFQAGL
jgi:hypothetical protein